MKFLTVRFKDQSGHEHWMLQMVPEMMVELDNAWLDYRPHKDSPFRQEERPVGQITKPELKKIYAAIDRLESFS